jgi:hypothetical protein
MRRARHRRRPSARARTLCAFCRAEGCAGSCVPASRPALPVQERALDLARDVVVRHAADRAARLVVYLGLPHASAARFMGSRMGLDAREVFAWIAHVRSPAAWRSGSLDRPTCRPPPRSPDLRTAPETPAPEKRQETAAQ